MKKLIFITAFLFLYGLSFSVGQITDQKGSIGLSDLIKKVEVKYNISVTYESDISAEYTQKEATSILRQKSPEKALTEIVKKKKLEFKKIRNDYYVLIKKADNKTSYIKTFRILEKTITGTVKDNAGDPIPGVSVIAKDENNTAAMTDIEGKFSITVTDNVKTLIFNYIGYKTKEVSIENRTELNIVMEEDYFDIEEVIVSGVAGNTPAKKLAVTINKVSADKLDDAPTSSSATALQGKIPGVLVKRAYGSPGSGATIQMRGATSIRGNSPPLIILDGVLVNTNLADINVDDIASMEVVKGAAASALYGSKAGNGVIVITTKRGKNLKDSYQIKVRNEYGISNLQRELDLATHHPYQLAADNADFSYTKYEGVTYDDNGNVVSGSRLPTDSAYADQPYSIVRDQQKEFFKQGDYYTNYVSMSKKDNNTNMFLSFENHKNSGIVFATEGYQRKNFRFNADTRIGKYISLSTSNMYMLAETDNPGTSKGFQDVLFVQPDVDLNAPNADGSPYLVLPDPWSIAENPLYPLYYRESTSKRNSFLTNISTKILFTDWLNLESKYTYEKYNSYTRGYNPKGYLYMDTAYYTGLLEKTHYENNSQFVQSTLNFDKVFGEFTVKSKLSYLYEQEDWDNTYTSGKDFVVDNIPQFNFADQTQSKNSSYDGSIRAIDIFGIADIDYLSKYIFSGLIRRDGSSLFGENQRWHTYYRLAGAYRISEDIKIPGIQELKIRAAIGTSGQRPGYSDQYETYSVSNGNLVKEQLGNKELKPSESTETEFALDAQFFNIFNLTGSYSSTVTRDALLSVPLASHVLGFRSQIRNAGTIKSQSLELSLNIKAIHNKKTNLSLGFNFDRIRQQIENLELNKYYTGPRDAFLIEPGQNFGIILGNKWLTSLSEMENQLPDGMTIDNYTINSDGYVILAGTEGSTVERPVALDADNDGTPDKVIIADCNPDFNLSFNTLFSYKNLSLYMLWSWKHGGDVYNKTKQYLFLENRAGIIDQYGKPEEQKKSIYYYQALYNGNNLNSFFVENGSYVKLREMSIAYTYKFNKENKISDVIKSVKFSLIGHNLLTLTEYTGYDPEVGNSTYSANFSYDSYGYPNFRTFTGSIEFIF